MISGDWGTGKTFLVRSVLRGRSDILYVSLNGTAKTAEVIERLYLAAYPVFADKTMKALGSIARTVGGAFRLKSELKVADLFDLDRHKILVFDDLERSLLSPEELMGFINNFVEHDSKHVILIANEKELENKSRYNQIREKVVGFSLNVKPDYANAIEEFINTYLGRYKEFLNKNKNILISVLDGGKFRNMRVVKYVLEEFEPIFNQMREAHIGDDDVLDMFIMFFILDYAYKIGSITREDINNRNTDNFAIAFLKSSEKYEISALDRLNEMFPHVDLLSNKFDNEYLVEKICDGHHNEQNLTRTLGDILGKTNSRSNPEWRNLWYLIHQNDDVIEESFNRMICNFHSRNYDDAGVILHVFGLLFQMRDVGLLNWSVARIVREGKKFISDKAQARTLPRLSNDYIAGFHHGSAHGLGFTSIKEPGFQDLATFYRAKSNEVRDGLILEEIGSILEAANFDINKFRGIILQGEREDNVYNRPFLHKISARKFCASLMKEDAKQQWEVLSALGSRYDSSPYPEVVTGESAWLAKIKNILSKEAKKASQCTRFRLNKLIAWHIDGVLKAQQVEQMED